MGIMTPTRSSPALVPENDASDLFQTDHLSGQEQNRFPAAKRPHPKDEVEETAKRRRYDSAYHLHKGTEIVQGIDQQADYTIINFGRLYARIRNQDLPDEIHLHIVPNAADDGTKIVKLETKIYLSEQDKDGGHTEPLDSIKPSNIPEPGIDLMPDSVQGLAEKLVESPIFDERVPLSSVRAEIPETDGSSVDDNPRNERDVAQITDEPRSFEGTQTFPPTPQNSALYLGEPREPLGFYEVGCLSYRSVVLQALAHSTAMRNYLDELTANRSMQTGFGSKFPGSVTEKCKPGYLSCYLRNVICSIWNENNKAKPTAADYNAFNNAIQSDYRQREAKGLHDDNPFDWKFGNQNPTDAGTALNWFAMLLANEQEQVRNKDRESEDEQPRKQPPRSLPCAFTVREQERCSSCGDRNTEETEHNVLILDNKDDSSLIERMIDRSTLRSLPNAACQKCNARSGLELEWSIIGHGPQLVFIEPHSSLSSDNERYASKKPITYPLTLDLGPYTDGDTANLNYSLLAVICHDGQDPSDAHWVLHARSPLGIFFIDDDWVSRSSVEGMLNPSMFDPKDGKPRTPGMKDWRPFILMYERSWPQLAGGDSAMNESLSVKREKIVHAVPESALRRSKRKSVTTAKASRRATTVD